MELLQVKAWLGRYVGFVLGLTGAVIAVPAIVGVSLPVSSVWKVFLFVSVAAIVLMPLSIAFGYWLLKRIGFALRARHFASGVGEGLVLAVVFAAIFAVSQYIQNAGNTDPLVSSSTIAPDRSSTSPGSGTRVEPLEPIQEILPQGDNNDAASPTSKAEATPDTGETLWQQAEVAFARGDDITAHNLIIRLRDTYPGTPAGDSAKLFLRAASLVDRGLYRDAEIQVSAALSLRPTSPLLLCIQGVLAVLQGHADRAMSRFDSALKSDPKCAMALVRRGELLKDQKKYDQAVADFSGAIELLNMVEDTACLAASHKQRADAYGFLGRYELAIVDLTEAIELAKKHQQPEAFMAHCYYLRARAHNALGSEDKMASDLAKVEEIRKRLQERQAGPATENR